jgi:hypothetical protein
MLKKLLIPALAVTLAALAAACTDNSGNGNYNPDAKGSMGSGGTSGSDAATTEDSGGDAPAAGTGGTGGAAGDAGGIDASVLDSLDLDTAPLG